MKKSCVDRFRNLDAFGAHIRLNYRGKAQYKTLGGACASFLFTILIFFYFVTLLRQVINQDDPQISSYQILEDRSTMTESLNLAELKGSFAFGFRDPSFQPIGLDSRIGRFKLKRSVMTPGQNPYDTEI